MAINIKDLENDLWDAADELRAGSRLSSQEYCMPVLGLIYLRYAFSRFKFVDEEIRKNLPSRGGRTLEPEASDYKAAGAIKLQKVSHYDYLLSLKGEDNIGKAVDDAMKAIENDVPELKGILPKNYETIFSGAKEKQILQTLLTKFNRPELDEIKDDIIGRIYEYFLNKFAKSIASDDGVFFTPKSLVRMIVNIIQPDKGTVLDPACGSGGMFVSSSDFVNERGKNAAKSMTFFGQEKVEFNAKLCIMNMAVHGLNAKIISGESANSFYNDAYNLEGKCDYVMANPPFNVNKVNYENAQNAGRLPFGLPGYNEKTKEIGNANYLWISYFYAYLNEKGRAGFVMASSATDSQHADKEIRTKLVETGDVDVILSVGNNFFYTLSLPCTLWFFDKGKKDEIKDKVLFIDARNYFTVIDRNFNEWTSWQIKNLSCIVHLYRGETEKYSEGNYADVAGLCKIATRAEIAEKNYSLTPGAYVGVAEVQDDDENFEERMKEIHKELNTLQNESNDLMATINANLKELGLEA